MFMLETIKSDFRINKKWNRSLKNWWSSTSISQKVFTAGCLCTGPFYTETKEDRNPRAEVIDVPLGCPLCTSYHILFQSLLIYINQHKALVTKKSYLVISVNICVAGIMLLGHKLFCFTTGPQPLPQRVLHRLRSISSSFKLQHPIF
jgi:hypothetical protein